MADAQDLRALLSAAGLSQAEFARRIGASVQCVNAWCVGRTGKSAERPALAYRLAVMVLEANSADHNFALNENLRATVQPLSKFGESVVTVPVDTLREWREVMSAYTVTAGGEGDPERNNEDVLAVLAEVDGLIG